MEYVIRERLLENLLGGSTQAMEESKFQIRKATLQRFHSSDQANGLGLHTFEEPQERPQCFTLERIKFSKLGGGKRNDLRPKFQNRTHQ